MQRPPTVLSHSVVAELQTSPMVVYDLGFVGMVAWAGKLANELPQQKKVCKVNPRDTSGTIHISTGICPIIDSFDCICPIIDSFDYDWLLLRLAGLPNSNKIARRQD